MESSAQIACRNAFAPEQCTDEEMTDENEVPGVNIEEERSIPTGAKVYSLASIESICI